MHELSICQALIAKIEAIAREHAGRVREVRVGIGALSGVEPQLLADAYPLACAGTGADGSRLAIEARPIRVRCRNCGAETAATCNRLVCGSCGDWRTELVSGDELMLLTIELETGDAGEPAAKELADV